MARPLQPRGRDPSLRRRLRAGRGLVARRDRGTLEPRLLPPRDAGPVRGGVALLPRHLGCAQEPEREHGRPDRPRYDGGLGIQRRRHVPPVPRGLPRGQGDLLRHRRGDHRPHPPGEVLRGARAGPGRRCDPQADGPRAADRPRPAGRPRGRGARGARAGGRGRGRPAGGTDSGRRHDRRGVLRDRRVDDHGRVDPGGQARRGPGHWGDDQQVGPPEGPRDPGRGRYDAQSNHQTRRGRASRPRADPTPRRSRRLRVRPRGHRNRGPDVPLLEDRHRRIDRPRPRLLHRGADHRLPVRPRHRDARGDHGRDRQRRGERPPHQGRRISGEGAPSHNRRL